MAINVDVLGNTQPLEAAVQSAVNRIRRRPIKITVDDKGATQPLGNMRRSADEFSKSMEAANARIIAFGASMAIINGVADAFKGMVRNVVEVEKALADINVVMGLSAQNLERFSDGLFTVAKETGQAFKIAADAATEYARQGLSMEESLKRTKDALILTRLTGMDSANAVKSLTAAMNTYGNQIKDTTQLVSKFAAVDVKFAVSAEDFADAIARTGAAARGAGVDIDELIGLVTAAQQQTARGGKVIGNSFKTIFTRIGRTDTLNQLENLGIAVRDVEGNTLGAKRILTDLANTFDSLTEAQKAQIAQTVGGVFQINVLKAVLGDAAKQNGILANATQISAGATDEAITKNEQLRQTMAAMATETGLAIKEVSAKIGEIALAPGMEKILNVVKSVAEGANNLLGDGESAGNKFANGFLKGLGNIITGPGLVVIVAVFGKLFLKAAQYARESLTSLIGVTTEAQKQKAIQTSLVNLFGQNAALSKEMLRTDISRTEKEKIILALLKAQVAEANVLNAVSKQAASTLYRQGFGANLAPRGRSGSSGGRAGGHVPNFAEREQAAKGGYAAGNIREMNMPGQGSVIYNSAEKVKNFAGMKQPAIMPPLSSKAGKNYQQAFGSVHGFDPYAGSGFVPNFNAGLIDARHVATMLIPFEGFGKKLSGGGKGVAPAAKGGKSVFGQKINSKILFNMLGVKRGGYAKSSKDNQGRVVPKALSELGDVIGNQTVKIANQLNLGNNIEKLPEASGSEILKKFLGPEGGRSGAKGAISGLYGAVFEEALSRRLKTESTERDYMGGDFDVRMATPELKKLFGPMAPRGDYKISDGRELQASMSSKIAKEVIFRGAKGSAPKLKMAQQMTGRSAIRLGGTKGGQPGLMSDGHIPNYAAAMLARFGLGVKSKFQMAEMIKNSPFKHQLTRYGHWKNFPPDVKKRFNKYLLSQGLTNKTLQSYGFLSKNSKSIAGGLGDFLSADGHVPNFANPLADAVNRERGAGVPVSQIRVGSHQALMNKGNPLGLGVTNTTDEPNGLRDVFGANGYVPNYVAQSSDFAPGMTDQSLVNRYNRNVKKLISLFEKGIYSQDTFNKRLSLLNKSSGVLANRQSAVTSKINESIGIRQKLNAGMNRASLSYQRSAVGRLSAGAGRMFSGNAGMMMMMGAPMAAGYLQGDGPGQTGAGGAAYTAGGALTGAASGGMMASMVAPFFGPAAPLVIGVGVLGGAIHGLLSATEENTKALQEQRDAQIKAQTQSMSQGLASIAQGEELVSELSSIKISEQNLKDIGLTKSNTVSEGLRKAFDIISGSKKEAPSIGELASQGKSVDKSVTDYFTNAKTGTKYYTEKQIDEKIAGMQERASYYGSKKDYKENMNIDELGRFLYKYSGPSGARTTSIKNIKMSQMYQRQAKGQVGLGERQIAASKQVKGELIDYLIENETGPFSFDFGKGKGGLQENLSKENYAKALKGEKFKIGKTELQADETAIETNLSKQVTRIEKEYLDKKKKNKDALILQLNLQNAMAQAQQATVLSQLDIKSNYANMANQTKMQAAFMGKFISDEQKVRNKYILAVNKAKESFESGSLAASGTLKTNILQDVAQNKSLESALKNEMFNDKEVRETLKVDKADNITKADLTLALAEMENEKLLEILTKIGVGQDEANKIVQNRLLLYNGSIDKLEKQNELSLKQAANEKSINMVLAQRKTLLDDMTDRIEEFNRKAAFNAERGAIEKAISDAQIKGTGYISADEQLARDRADMNNRIIPDMRAQGKGKSLEALKALGVGFTKEEQDKIMQMTGDDLDITSIVKEQREEEFRKAGGTNRISQIESFHGPMEPDKAQAMQAELEKLKTLDEQRKGINDKLNDEINETNNKLKDQNVLNDKNVQKVKEEMLARERMRARMTGPGAAGFGFEDGMNEMRDRIKTMDYELTKSIPGKLADGLATAMTEAVNGAKDLGDALEDAALNFLSYIQQAMMQKLAMQAVGALGFSQGGGVRKYSSGGNVPAMVTNGEYVMGRSAAKKYGGGFMHSLNARGKVPNYSMGGDTMQEYGMGGIPRYNTGGDISNRKYRSKQMSGFFYSGQAGSIGLQEDEQTMRGIFAERERQRQEAEQKRLAKKAKRRQLLGMGLSIVGMGLINYGFSGGFSSNNALKGNYKSGSTGRYLQSSGRSAPGHIDHQDILTGNIGYASRGGKIGKYASGGMIHGKSGIDQIPAMLSEGEYVIKASSARQLGKPMLDQINAGRFFNGGEVSKMDESESSSLGGNTNNINISVNVEKGQVTSQESQADSQSSPNQKERSDDQNQLLAQKIKQQVVAVIVEEQRPGGLLND